MAFSNAQRVMIRRYVGWHVYGTFDTTIESSITLAGSDADAQAAIVSILASITEIEAQIFTQHSIAKVASAEEAKLNELAYAQLRTAGRRESNNLANALNVSIKKDVWATSKGTMNPQEG